MDVLLLALRVLLAILLYTFLAVILYVLWQDLRQTLSKRQTTRPGGQLVVLFSPDEALRVGTNFPLQPVTSIGRSPDNSVAIPDSYASAQNSLLVWRETQWWLEDQNSRNGTMLNNVPITRRTVVSAGDIIGVGRTQLKLELDQLPPTRV
jgi:pSer/pThr/pTyr-binding forkhead associated (FHA) protein